MCLIFTFLAKIFFVMSPIPLFVMLWNKF